MRNATEELCLVIGISSKKSWVKFIPIGDGTESFWDDLGASYNTDEVDFQHLGLYKMNLKNVAGIGRRPRYVIEGAPQLLVSFKELVAQQQ
ncbi:Uncharacterised protein [Streptococcus pneumoniae]|nr:Uncharacterised protein [Streptococcus pneumoniae]